jgi:fumarate reductase subunit D
LPKSDGDKDFLERVHNLWQILWGFAALLLSPVLWQLFFVGDHSSGTVSSFLILLGFIVLPFVVGSLGTIFGKVMMTFVSWVMLATAILTMLVMYLYVAFWRVHVLPLFVPSVMSRATFGSLWGIVDFFVVLIPLTYIARRLIRYFQANLKVKSYRKQLPSSIREFRSYMLLLFLCYLFLAYVVTELLFF